MGLHKTVTKLAVPGKGILAADESSPTIKKRFDSVGIESSPETRHTYRHTIFSTECLEEHISGVILFDETLRSQDTIEPLKQKGICLGIKVDKGAKPYDNSGGKLTEGLDGLTERLREYKDLGAEFAKWRAVITVDDSDACIIANAWTLARYAKKCQDQGLVPIVEPEVIMDGDHSICRSLVTTSKALHHLFDALYYEGVELEAIVLKPNMILQGYDNKDVCQLPCPSAERWKQPLDAKKYIDYDYTVSDYTMECFRRDVPAAVPMIAFLSGGQPDGEATKNLNGINQYSNLPWYVSFSFGRELQQNAIKEWANGEPEEAKATLLNAAARCGKAAVGELII